VIADAALLESIGMRRKRSISLHVEGQPSIDMQELYEAAASCFSKDTSPAVEDSLGKRWRLTSNEAGEAWAHEEEGTGQFQISHAQLMSRENDLREEYIRTVYRAHGVQEQHIPWGRLTQPSVDSVETFEEDLKNTARGFSERLEARLQGGSMQGSDLVPGERLYFERLVGARGESKAVKDFALARRTIEAGRPGLDWLELDLLVSAHSNLVPLSTIKSAPRGELKSWLVEWLDALDLWSLTGLLEGLLSREDLVMEFATEAAKGIRLLAEHAHATSDRLQLQSTLIAHIDCALNTGQTLASEPPFWRRSASIAHSALVERVLLRASVSLPTISKWAAQASPRFHAATLCDLVQEPRWHGYLLQPGQLSQELIGRVMNAAQVRRAEIEGSSLGELIFADAEGSLASKWRAGLAGLPGPLEGDAAFAPPLPEQLIEETASLLEDPERPLYERLLVAAHTVGFGKAPHTLAADIAAKLRSFDASLAEVEERVMHQIVVTLAMAASDCRHADLAKAVEDFLIHRPNLPIAVRLHAGLTAYGAFDREGDWIDAVVSLARRLMAQGLDSEQATHVLFVLTTMCDTRWSLRGPLGGIIARLRASAQRM
jgi:hypothetical protein